MGVSVISGAITTGGASIFLVFTTMIIFYKFGIFILSTIVFSLLISLLYFPGR